MIKYNKDNIHLAKTLRKNMTPQERKLWYEFLRNHRLRFQRQKSIGNYIVDFYCAKSRLVIELDGGGHYEDDQIEKDRLRTLELNNFKLNVLRFANTDIDNRFDDVCKYINHVVEMSLPQSSSMTAPSSEGAKPSDLPPLPKGRGTTLCVVEGFKGRGTKRKLGGRREKEKSNS